MRPGKTKYKCASSALFVLLLLYPLWTDAQLKGPIAKPTVAVNLQVAGVSEIPGPGGRTIVLTPPRVLVRIKFVDENGFTCLAPAVNPIFDLQGYTLLATRNDETSKVKLVKVYSYVDAAGAASIYLEPADRLKSDANYTLKLRDPWTVRSRDGRRTATYRTPDEEKDLPRVDARTVKIEQEYLNLMGLENYFGAQRADKGTALTLQARYRYNDSMSASHGWLHLEAIAKADIGLDTKLRNAYSDNIKGEVGAFYGNYFGKPGAPFRIPYFLGFNNLLEATRNFDTVDGSAGLWTKFYTPDVLKWLGGLFVRPDDRDEALPAPLWEFGYTYVSRFSRAESARSFGSQRINGKFTWDLPLLRHQRLLSELQINSDLIFELSGIYHVESGAFTDESRIILAIRQDTESSKAPSFTLTYSRGKAAPKFDNYEAILAGFRVPF